MSTNLNNTKSMVLKQAAPLRSVVSKLSEAEDAKLDERTGGPLKPSSSQDGELKAVQFRPKQAVVY